MKAKLLFVYGFIILFSCRAYAQEEIVPSPSQVLSKIPFTTLTGGVIVLKATLDNHPDSLNFILDTGSGGISLDSTLVDHLDLQPTPTSVRIRGVAGVREVSYLYNKSLNFPEYTVDSLNFHINDYSFLSSIYGVRVDGIIGYSVFSRYIVKIDYDEHYIELCSQGTLRYPKGGFLLKPNIKSLVVQGATLRDKHEVNARFLHDIGAGVCVMLSKEFVEDSTLLSWNRKLWPKEGHGLGGKIEMQLTVIKQLRFGPYRFRHVPTLIFDDVFDVTSYPYLGGLIGNDILRRFNMIYNYAKGDIHLTPNKSYRDRFDYAYSGLDLLLIDSNIVIGSVIKGSPADIAGLKKDDLLLAVDNNFSMDFSAYKKALQRAKKTVTLLIRREEELHLLKMKIKSIRQVI
ncbi:aspartyl protease family protein [Olivibacter sp. SDN3]|uniref:pepsin/retropepsin-like aspartic protease family protein n=1 Tax=Olivibacter sp. SDN3 TaxID=2764720 RepID=UPI0016510B71|nr:aspartyl protease family protein [Olivibacter sp. SDN3]QNL50134.1 aspartyl protease family protein [Olivibacter sp. SDN3]